MKSKAIVLGLFLMLIGCESQKTESSNQNNSSQDATVDSSFNENQNTSDDMSVPEMPDDQFIQVWPENITLSEAWQIKRFSDFSYKEFSGSFTIENFDSESLDLSFIKRIRGDLIIQNNPRTTSALLGDLEVVEGKIIVSGNPVLGNIDFAKLNSNGGLFVVENETLSSIYLPSLKEISYVNEQDDSMTIQQNSFLTSISAPVFERANGNISILSNYSLTDLSFPELKSLGGGDATFIFSGNDALTNCSIPTFETRESLPDICK